MRMSMSIDIIDHCRVSNPLFANMHVEEIRYFVNRYENFWELCKNNPEVILAPTKDIDEVWHTHMLRPVNYISDCNSFFGYVLDHDGYSGREDESNEDLEIGYKNLERLWLDRYGEDIIPNIEGSESCNTLVEKVKGTQSTSRGAGIRYALIK
jgi:hypothetical protein